MGKIVHPGSTNFSKGQIVYYSEYSASRIYDFGAMDRGEKSYSEVTDDKLGIFVVAEDDIMAFEEVVDDTGTVSVPAKKDQPKATD